MQLLFSFLITYLIFSIWLWVAEALFGSQHNRTKIVLFAAGVLIAIWLLLFPSLLDYLGVSSNVFGVSNSPLIATIIGYTILASHEEILKFSWSMFSYIRQHLTKNDLILYSIFIALGFAFAENIIYVIREAEGASVWLAISRGLTWFLGHAIFTWVIWFIATKLSGKKQILSIIWGIIVWVFLHTCYNLMLHYGIILGFLLFILWGYVLLTYLFYSSDRIYLADSSHA